ncbi:MAG: histidine triad nucleotide-binding protein [Bdellovibrionota bacterium]
MSDCIFCKIQLGQIPAKKIAESELAFAIADISPQAPVHALVIPKKHVASLNEMGAEDRETILPDLFALADRIATEKGIRAQGYRTVINNQLDAGQTVFHLHLHVLGGAKLKGGFGA